VQYSLCCCPKFNSRCSFACCKSCTCPARSSISYSYVISNTTVISSNKISALVKNVFGLSTLSGVKTEDIKLKVKLRGYKQVMKDATQNEGRQQE
jgi:hypothetical protein